MITEEDISQLQKRNEDRVKQMISELGEKWLLHPNNRVKKNPNARSEPILKKNR